MGYRERAGLRSWWWRRSGRAASTTARCGVRGGKYQQCNERQPTGKPALPGGK